jgi:hypothetical protein
MEIEPMTETITTQSMNLLRMVAKFPDVSREKLLALNGISEADLDYLVRHDLIREREPGHYRVSNFGQMALKRGM